MPPFHLNLVKMAWPPTQGEDSSGFDGGTPIWVAFLGSDKVSIEAKSLPSHLWWGGYVISENSRAELLFNLAAITTDIHLMSRFFCAELTAIMFEGRCRCE